MAVGSDRSQPGVTDISSADQLLRYAVAGQLAKVLQLRPDISQAKIAQAAGLGSSRQIAGANLSHALRQGPTASQLQRLDRVIGAALPYSGDSGSLSSLALWLSGQGRDKAKDSSLLTNVSPTWTSKLLRSTPTSDVEVLVQASALLSTFQAAEGLDSGKSIASFRDQYRDEIDLLVRRLILIAVAPPTSSSYDAQIMLGSLCGYVFELMRDRLESDLRHSPLGFRVWRVIAKLVTLSARGRHTDALKVWVRRLIRDAEELRRTSLYAGTSLDLELALTIPAAWSSPGDDWLGDALWARARDSEATIRERGTAAMGLWQRAIGEGQPQLQRTEADLRELIAEFRDADTRPDAAAGLRWVAATLEYVVDQRVPVCNEWPDIDEPWYRRVQDAASRLDGLGIPDRILADTKILFRHMVLQNSGIYRHQAIGTVVTSGWSEPVARAIGFLLDTVEGEPWLRIRAIEALGNLQIPDLATEADLTLACQNASKSLMPDGKAEPNDKVDPVDETSFMRLPRAQVTEMHASLFAVGDCFGAEGVEERAKTVREGLRPILIKLATMEGDDALILRRPTRAAAYLLTFTAPPGTGGQKDFSQELLEKLSSHPDPVTARLSQWALRFRFAPNGTIQPLLATVGDR